MRHYSRNKQAFTLVELLVVIAIIGTLVGLLLPAVQSAREAARGNSCRIHLTELQRALLMYENDIGNFPGYVETVGDGVTNVELPWVGTILPYLEQKALYDHLVRGEGSASPSLEIMICPSDPPDSSGGPSSNYLANAGWIANERPHDTGDCSPVENIANGVFFDRTRLDGDIRDLDPSCVTEASDPIYKVSMATIQSKGDGSTNTLMLAEGISALYWNYVGGRSPNKKWDFGFCWAQPGDIAEARETSDWGPKETGIAWQVINGVRENVAGNRIADKPPNSAFPSSRHPNGVNVGFVAGQVQFLREDINAVVYAQLMTSNRKKSDLHLGDKADRDLRQPGANDY